MDQGKLTIEQVKEHHQSELLSIDGVEGIGIGEEEDRPVIKVYVSDKSKEVQSRIPRELQGYPVRIEMSGEFNIIPAGGP